jgi:glycerol-3-phosphate dehydrogenase
MTQSELNATQRARALERMRTDTFDVVIIGGGVTGAGIALDACSRGLSVALVEQGDLACATSSKSSKLIHGGLRYLEMLDFRLVREALQERALLMGTVAPHLVKPVPFLWPLTHRVWERIYVGAGLLLYDRMARDPRLPHARHFSKAGTLRIAPDLNPDGLVGGIQFWDAQEDDARYVMFVARTAAELGAQIATRVRATGLVRDGERVVGVEVRDLESDSTFTVRARHVASAVGVWSEQWQRDAGFEPAHDMRPSKGIHIVVPRERLTLHTGILARTEKSVLFIIPWGDYWLIGDTDTAWELDLDHPTATRADVSYLLSKVNSLFARPIGHSDIHGVFAGLRPLVAEPGTTDTTRLSRDHVIADIAPGLTAIAGGKFTTYRVMAKDAMDVVARHLGPKVSKSRTSELPLVGAGEHKEAHIEALDRGHELGISREHIDRLASRYGSCILDVLSLIEDDRDLGFPIEGAPGHLRAEVVYACKAEGALHLEDIMDRRTRIAIQRPRRGQAAAEEVAKLAARALGWDTSRLAEELAAYEALVRADMAGLAEERDEVAVARFRAELKRPTQTTTSH